MVDEGCGGGGGVLGAAGSNPPSAEGARLRRSGGRWWRWTCTRRRGCGPAHARGRGGGGDACDAPRQGSAARLGTIPASAEHLEGGAIYVTGAGERRSRSPSGAASTWVRLRYPGLFHADEAWVRRERVSAEGRRQVFLQPLCDDDPGPNASAVDLTRWRLDPRPPARSEPPRPVATVRGCLAFRGLACGVGAEYEVATVGAERARVLTVRGALRFPQLLRRRAAALNAEWRFDARDSFPGGRLPLPRWYLPAMAQCIGPLVRTVYGVDIRSPGRRAVCPLSEEPPTTPPWLPVQHGFLALAEDRRNTPLGPRWAEENTHTHGMVSHHDSMDGFAHDAGLAAVHALVRGWPAGARGTAFFADRATRMERARPGREAAHHRAAWEVRRHLQASVEAGHRRVTPVHGSTEYEQLVHASDLEYNAIVIFNFHALHAAHLAPDISQRLSRHPESGRLTANLFWEQTGLLSSRSAFERALAAGNLHCGAGWCTAGQREVPISVRY